MGESAFALEGFVPAAGAALDWLAEIGLLPPGPSLDPLLARATSVQVDLVAEPALTASERRALRDRWAQAAELTARWGN